MLGRRNNILRNRIDSAEYDLDQLILAALFFTVLVFLFPTVAVYYILFSVYRVGIIMVQGILEVLLALLNHFPLFSILLRLKDPHRVSSGICIKIYNPQMDSLNLFNLFKAQDSIKNSPRKSRSPIRRDRLMEQEYGQVKEIKLNQSYLMMTVSAANNVKSVPISYSSIFYQYNYIANE